MAAAAVAIMESALKEPGVRSDSERQARPSGSVYERTSSRPVCPPVRKNVLYVPVVTINFVRLSGGSIIYFFCPSLFKRGWSLSRAFVYAVFLSYFSDIITDMRGSRSGVVI